MIKTLLFTTFSIIVMLLSCGNPTTTDDDPDSVIDADWNVYTTVKIGNQLWTVENLRTTKYNDGSAIPHITDSAAWDTLTTPGYCFYNNTIDEVFIKKYGALYNWYAVDTKKLAPIGWHVPTDADWDTLQNYLIANGYNWDGDTTRNKIAKSMATKTDWLICSSSGAVGNDLPTNNRSGFSALPGGFRDGDATFSDSSYIGCWWSSTEAGPADAWERYLNYDSNCLYRNFTYKGCGFSVRLVRD